MGNSTFHILDRKADEIIGIGLRTPLAVDFGVTDENFVLSDLAPLHSHRSHLRIFERSPLLHNITTGSPHLKSRLRKVSSMVYHPFPQSQRRSKRNPSPLFTSTLNSHLHPLMLKNYVPAHHKEYRHERRIQHRLRFTTPTEGQLLKHFTAFQREVRGFECGSACGEASVSAVVC
jgi:hypothetical protein